MKKKLTMVFVSCVALSMTIGCTVFGAETVKSENGDLAVKMEQMKPDREHEKGVAAKVVTVNEDTLVVNLAERPEMPEGEEGEMPPERPEGEEGEMPPERPEGEEGERPERPEGEKGERPPRLEGEEGEMPPRPEGEEGEMPPERPEGEEGEMPPERPEGEEGERPPRHGMGMMKEMNFATEEVEITLNENIVIDLGAGEEGSMEDIAEDDIIMISYEEDGTTVKSISVRKPNN